MTAMFDAIAPRYDAVNTVMTFGLDGWWRRRALDLLELAPGDVVLDVGCGTGDFVRALGRRGASAIGLDLSAGMLSCARSDGQLLVRADAASLPVRAASLDAVVSGFALRNFADLPGVLAELGRVVRPGGRIALLEVDEPSNRLVRQGYELWFRRAVPRIGRLLSDADAYRYLPRSVAYLPGAEELLGMLATAGFAGPRRHRLLAGGVQVLTGTRR